MPGKIIINAYKKIRTLARSAFHGFSIGFQRCKKIGLFIILNLTDELEDVAILGKKPELHELPLVVQSERMRGTPRTSGLPWPHVPATPAEAATWAAFWGDASY